MDRRRGARIVVVLGLMWSVMVASPAGAEPTVVDSLPMSGFDQVDVGVRHSCGLTSTGTAWCWGRDDLQQLGNGDPDTTLQATPVRVDQSPLPDGVVFTQLTAGGFHTCGLTSAGTAWCWGRDASQQLGNGDPDTIPQASPVPVDMSSLPDGVVFTQLTTGTAYTCGLTSAGTAWCWGADGNQQLGNGSDATVQASPVPVDMGSLPDGVVFTQLTTGTAHTCGLTSAGTAWCWGDDSVQQLGNGNPDATLQATPVPVDQSPLPDGVVFTKLTAGTIHTCGLTSAGTAWCWGDDRAQQLGNGSDATDQATPVPVDTSALPDGVVFTQLTAGGFHTCGLTSVNTAWCWGADDDQQLGNGNPDATDQATPVPVDQSPLPPGIVFTQLTAAGSHTCGLTSNGTAWCWGDDDSQQLGNGPDTIDQATPVPVDQSPLPPGIVFTQVAAGYDHTCGLTSAGTAWCWGRDTDQQLGNGNPDTDNQATPIAVDQSPLPPGVVFTQLTAGPAHTCGLTSNGTAWCWGSDSAQQLGNGNPDTDDQATPVPVDTRPLPTGLGFTQLTAAGDHTCGLTSVGTAWCWGADIFQQLGNGNPDSTDQASPVPVDQGPLPPGVVFTQLTAGLFHTCGLTSVGTAWCWGDDIGQQLGNGNPDTTDQATPVPVDQSPLPPGIVFTQLTAGGAHTCGLTSAGTAWCWGADGSQQLGDGNPDTDEQATPAPVDASPLPTGVVFTQLTATFVSTCGLTSAGTAYCWGNDIFQQGGDGNPDTDDQPSPVPVDTVPLPVGVVLTQLIAAGFHSCGLTSVGTTYCWGNDGYQQLGNGASDTGQASPVMVFTGVGVDVADVSGQVGDTATFTAVLTGVGPAVITWDRDGESLVGQTRASTDRVVTAADLTGPATFTGTVTNAFLATAADGGIITDTSAPAITIEQAAGQTDPTTTSPVTFDVVFTEDVTGFDDPATDVVIGGTATTGTPTITGTGATYLVSVPFIGPGTITATIPAGAATDPGDNPSLASTSTDNTVTAALIPVPVPLVPAEEADLSLSATSTGPGVVQIAITNDGRSTATPDPITITLPSGTLATSLPETCTVDDDVLTCTPGPLAAGATLTLALPLQPPTAAPMTLDVVDIDVVVQPVIPDDVGQAALLIARTRFPTDGTDTQLTQARPRAAHVVLSRDDLFADSLTGSALTGDGPMLLTPPTELPAAVSAEVDRLLAGAGTVYLLGGEAAIAPTTAQALTDAGYAVVRLAGASRVQTAIAIADAAAQLTGPAGTVAIARATAPVSDPTAAWADAVAAGGWAADTSQPILLTPTDAAHPDTLAWLGSHTGDVVVLGGTAAITDDVARDLGATSRVAGQNRYATAAAIAQQLWADPTDGRILTPATTTDSWAFTLAAAGLAADTDQPILLTDLDRLPPDTDTALCTPDGSRRAATLLTPTPRTTPSLATDLTTACTLD